MIARVWRGVARTEEADAYVRHLQNDTFPALARIPGFVDAAIWRRDVALGVEFTVVTHWESIDTIRQFAGEPVDLPFGDDPAVEFRQCHVHRRVERIQAPSRRFPRSPTHPAGDGLQNRHVQLSQCFVGQVEVRCGQVLSKMHQRRRAGNEKNVWRTAKQPRERDLHWRGAKTHGHIR